MRERGPLGILGSIFVGVEWFVVDEVLALLEGGPFMQQDGGAEDGGTGYEPFFDKLIERSSA